MRRAIHVLDTFWFERAPATRPAILRILVGLYTLYYLAPRYAMYMKIARSDQSLFKPVGVASNLKKPVPVGVFRGLLIATFVANVLFVLGFRHRYTGPVFAGLLLWVMSYRNSWSMIYHSNNVLLLHAMILSLSRSADALSLDSLVDATESEDPHWRYGWPIRLMNTVTTLTYFLAGVAKVKGPLGWKWGGGESLRSQIAVDGLRKEVDGGEAAPLAYVLHNNLFVFTIMGVGSLVLELVAPATLVSKRLSRLWAIGAFQLHWGIFLLMKIRFRYQMAGLVFAPFFDLDRVLTWIEHRGAGRHE
ncbi:MAG: HTTM domain-containing protein [Rubrobacter sp.]